MKMREFLLSLPDAQATLDLGTALGELLREGRGQRPPIMLRGALGSGKTTLVRGIVAALPGSRRAEVCSPSFTILNFYPTEPPVLHADLYRCPAGSVLPEELEEALDPGATHPFLVLLEWPEFLPGNILPAERLDILLEECHAARRFSVAAHGEAACAVRAALLDWAVRRHPEWVME
jgi:tRNA threonylcarbamoyladenosine biosynthesis protein TsaE